MEPGGLELPSEVHPTVEDPRVERARYWRFSGLPDTELLTARFVTTTFTRHTHPTYTIGMITAGIEEYTHPRGRSRVGPGGLAVVGPGEVHTGHAGIPEGWGYRVFYPAPEVVEGIGRELGMRGTPGFTESGIDAPEVARVLVRAHMAAERGERLTASSLTRQGIAMLLRSHGRERAREGGGHAARPEVLRVRELLAERLVDPPTLEELAAHTGIGAFALSRAFRSAYGLPPHAYLNQMRVDRARALLVQGRRAGEVAVEVGFADQPHLTRHFRRHLGVPPVAYQRALRAS
ncbi:AraC family transcriptional regulator [Nocardiopsis exhalans]|uniref:AraC family transcriptional regulator n=1 Tax=Nocardiopsis exhalans TaxID=163604 RepID=A0ABY5DFS5_9ACTN|nr:AraC family transcriptional regulator [Nocardiopsis exhalans]USY22195.1 AraC family transcriptional regulator [Nocardiopsis exhalans]